MAKLTLSSEQGIVNRAKKLAKRRRTSLSSMVTHYLDAVSGGEDTTGAVRLGPLTLKASGLLKLPPGSSYEDLLGDALADKHGLRP